MHKKHLILIIVILGIISTVLSVGWRSSKYSPMGGMMGAGDLNYIQRGSMMDDDTFFAKGENLGMGVVSDIVVQNKMIPEPISGIMPPYYGDNALDVEERSYEKSSHHSVVVKDVSKYIRGMKEYFSSINGVVLSSSISSLDKYDTASLYVKVPIEKFDEATGRITEDVTKIVDESINAQDITGQVVRTNDNVIALEEQKALKEAELKDAKTELAKTRIKIEIDRLDRRIDSAKQAQGNVETRTKYASVSITVASNDKYFNPGSRGDFSYELERAWESLKSFIKAFSVFGIWIVVYSVVWAPIIWIVNKVAKRFKKS